MDPMWLCSKKITPIVISLYYFVLFSLSVLKDFSNLAENPQWQVDDKKSSWHPDPPKKPLWHLDLVCLILEVIYIVVSYPRHTPLT